MNVHQHHSHLLDVEEDIIVRLVKQHAHNVLQVMYALTAMVVRLIVGLVFMLMLLQMNVLSVQQDGLDHQVQAR